MCANITAVIHGVDTCFGIEWRVLTVNFIRSHHCNDCTSQNIEQPRVRCGVS